MTSARVSVTINDCRSSDKSFVQIPQIGVCSAEIVDERGIIARPLGNIARTVAPFTVLNLEFLKGVHIFVCHFLRPMRVIQLFVDRFPNHILRERSLRRLAAGRGSGGDHLQILLEQIHVCWKPVSGRFRQDPRSVRVLHGKRAAFSGNPVAWTAAREDFKTRADLCTVLCFQLCSQICAHRAPVPFPVGAGVVIVKIVMQVAYDDGFPVFLK